MTIFKKCLVSYYLNTFFLYSNELLDIDRNVYYGNDYLPAIYEQWMSDTNRYSFLIVFNNTDEIIGFFSLSWYKLDEMNVFVEQA